METFQDKLLTPSQAASLLGLSRSWLAKLRLTGDGPAFIKLGRQVRYRRCDLNAWLQGQMRRSTSEYGQKSRAKTPCEASKSDH